MPQRSSPDSIHPNEKEGYSPPRRKKDEKTILDFSFGQHEDASYVILEEN